MTQFEKTAVMELLDYLEEHKLALPMEFYFFKIRDFIFWEKEQIRNAYLAGQLQAGMKPDEKEAEQYYYKTFLNDFNL